MCRISACRCIKYVSMRSILSLTPGSNLTTRRGIERLDCMGHCLDIFYECASYRRSRSLFEHHPDGVRMYTLPTYLFREGYAKIHQGFTQLQTYLLAIAQGAF